MKTDDKERIEAAAQKLSEASGNLAQKMYADAAAQSGDAGQQDNNGGDDVVDAEFEEVKDK